MTTTRSSVGAAAKVRLPAEVKANIESLAARTGMRAADIYRMCFEIGLEIANREGVAGLVKRIEEIRANSTASKKH